MRKLFFTYALLAATVFPSSAMAATAPGSLIKLACPYNADVTHPCKAVYYYGGDGKRHAFPNEKTYFTWYADFDGVQTVSASIMASLALGRNVTPRPGVRMVKFQTDPKTYAVALGGTLRWVKTEAAAVALYGAGWNGKIDDVSDAFFGDFRFGEEIASASAYDPAAERAFAATINDDLPSTRRSLTVASANGNFSVELIKLQKERYRMLTDTAEGKDCGDACSARNLDEYVRDAGAEAAIHGSYFCPPDYADCANKINTFLSPWYDTDGRVMINEHSLDVHQGPMLSYASDGTYSYFHRTKQFNVPNVEAAASNYPSLIEGGVIVVQSESKLDDGMKTIKGVRGAIGVDARFVYLAIVRSATVPDTAAVMKALGATEALNLDGGGSAAMWYDGDYVFGPGRLLPNAILFKRK